MTDEPWPEGREPNRAMIDAAGWLSSLIGDPSDENLAKCKAWFEATEENRKAFAGAMFSTPMSDEIRAHIGNALETNFQVLHTIAPPSLSEPLVPQSRPTRSPWGSSGSSRARADGQKRSRQREIVWIGAAAACLAAVALAMNLAPNLLTGSIFSAARAETLETGHGMIRSFALSDGSNVTLDADTRVDIRMDREERHASLRHGRARFVVKADPRPFKIDAGSGQIVSSNGTIDITIDPGQRVNVQLRSGSAATHKADEQASADQESRSLIIDRPIIYPMTEFAPQILASPVADTDSWPAGWVSYRAISLAALIGEANRYAEQPITLDDVALGRLTASGRFKLTDTAGFTARIAELFDLSVARQPDGTHLSRK